MKKRLHPYIFQSSVTYLCALFLFWKLVHRNRDWVISISALGCVLEGKKGRMTVAHWERERKASKCLNNYLSSWVLSGKKLAYSSSKHADLFIASLIKYTRNFGASPLLPFPLNEPSRRGESASWILVPRLLPEPGEPWTQNNSPDSPVSGLWSGLLGSFALFPTLLGNNRKAEEEHTQPGRSLSLSVSFLWQCLTLC